MAAVSSLNFNVYEQYTSDTNDSGGSSQSGALQAGVTVGTDDGSSYGSAVVLDIKQAPATKKLADGEKAVNTLTQVANYARTQAPKDAAASRLAQAIQELRAINLVGGGIRAVQEAVRVAQDIASAVRDLASAEEAIAADGGGSSGGSDGASAGAAAAAAISAALSGSSTGPTAGTSPATASTATPTDTSGQATPAQTEAGYSGEVGNDLTGLIAGQSGLGSGAQANQKVSSSLAQDVIAELQATGLPVDASNLTGSLQDLISNPLLGAQELQASARQSGLTVTVATSLDVKNTLTDPRNAAASGVSAAAGAAAIDDPYDELIGDAVAALDAIGKGLKKALPPLLNSPNKKIAREAKKAQDQFGQAVADTVKSIADYYSAKSTAEAEGINDGTPSPATKAQIDAADAVVHGPNAGNNDGGTSGDDAGVSGADTQLGNAAAVSDDGAPSIAAGSVASTSIGIHVSVNIQV
jgi:hypothetical protein